MHRRPRIGDGRSRNGPRLVAAIAAGGQLDGLLQALQARETRRAAARGPTRRRCGQSGVCEPLTQTVSRDDLLTLATSWRQVLADDPTHAQTDRIVAAERARDVHADSEIGLVGGSRAGLIRGPVYAGRLQVVWRPQRDSNPRFGLERATSWASGRWGQQGRVLRLRSTPEHVSVAVLGRSRQIWSSGSGPWRKDSVHPRTNSYTVVSSDCVTLGTPLRAGRAQQRALGAARAGRGTAGRLGCVRSPGTSPAVARCRPRSARRVIRRAR